MLKLTSLEAIEDCQGLIPATEKDRKVINEHLDQEIELTVDNNLRVWSEAGIYIADLVEIE